MTDLVFRALVSATLLVTLAGLAADDIGARGLPDSLRRAKAAMKERVVSGSSRLQSALRISVVLGYLLSLPALAFFVPHSPWAFLFFTLAWSGLTFHDAPHIHPRAFVPLYEASLVLNGALLALCFLTPLQARFG